MTAVKIERVVSVTSEDEVYCANNLLSDDTFRKWTSAKAGEPSISIILQLEKPVQISGIDIGNEGSAFIEVLGGTAAEPEKFEVLLPASSFMSPSDCRNGQNGNRVRMFTRNDIATSARDRRWDRVKVICSQPFAKDVKYGMSFLKIYTKSAENKECKSLHGKIGAFTLNEVEPVKSLFKTKNTTDQTFSKPVNAGTHTTANVDSEASSALKRAASASSSNSQHAIPVKRPSGAFSNDDLVGEMDRSSESLSDTIDKENAEGVGETDDLTSKEGGTDNGLPLSSVVFSLSGFQNPRRSELRDYGTELGARYSPPWTPSCTHLICAFPNTPKFEEAIRQKAVIVREQWLVDCYKERKMVPTERYSMGGSLKAVKGQKQPGSAPAAPDRSPTPPLSQLSIPSILKSEFVYVDPWLSEQRNCKRLVIAYGGRFSDNVSDPNITVAISDQSSTTDLNPLRQSSKPVVSIGWLQRIHDTEKPVNKDNYTID